jgi:serine/threonine protein kinase
MNGKMNSPYIVKYFGCYKDKIYKYYVMEYCNGGNLRQLIEKHKERQVAIPEDVLFFFLILFL